MLFLNHREVACSFVWNYQFLTSAVIRASWPILMDINRKWVAWLCYGLDESRFDFRQGQELFLFPKVSKACRGLNSIVSYVCRGFSPGVQSARCLLKIPGLLIHYIGCADAKFYIYIHSFIHSFHWHVRNATIPCCSHELLPFLSLMYFFLLPFSTNYYFILPHFYLLSISWFTSQSCCSQIHL